MIETQKERRRGPRVNLVSDEFVRIEVRYPVQVLDISLSGALIACGAALPLGVRGRLHAGLSALPFSAEVTIGRHHGRPGTAPHAALGMIFSSMDERSRDHLDRFLRKSSD